MPSHSMFSTHPSSPPTPNPPNLHLPNSDAQIAHALTAWLAALDVIPPSATFDRVAATCAPLCSLFATIAPHLLSERDFFQSPTSSASNTGRHLRVNIRRLARALASYFALNVDPSNFSSSTSAFDPAASHDDDAASLSNLSVSSDTARDAPSSHASTPSPSPTAAPVSPPPPPASPSASAPSPAAHVLSDAYSRPLLLLSHAPVRTDPPDAQRAALLLAECLLCAAAKSPRRADFIGAVMALPHVQQETLARSLSRVSPAEAAAVGAPHQPTAGSDGYVDMDTDGDDAASAASHMVSSALPPAARANTMPTRPRGHGAPPSVPLADYKALASERDALRRKLAAADTERVNSLAVESALRKDAEDASDLARQLELRVEHLQAAVAEKENVVEEAQERLRAASDRSEEVELLRTRAATVEQLEASLKRASARLEEMAGVNKHNKELEEQLSAFRENELAMTKQVEYLDKQLASSTERGNHLAGLVDALSLDLQNKDADLAVMTAENESLKQKLETVSMQFESMFVENTTSASIDTNTMTTSATPAVGVALADDDDEDEDVEDEDDLDDDEDMGVDDAAEGATVEKVGDAVADVSTPANAPSEGISATSAAAQAALRDAASSAPSDFDSEDEERTKHIVSELLLDAIGVRVRWEDVVECMRGVMDAMHDMEESAALEERSAQQRIEHNRVSDFGSTTDTDVTTPTPSDGMRRLRVTNGNIRRMRPSQQSERSDAEGRMVESGSDAFSKLSFVPEFAVLDAKLKAKNNGDGDEFDFAANLCNVEEIPVGNQSTPQGAARRGGAPSEEYESSYTESYETENDERLRQRSAEEVRLSMGDGQRHVQQQQVQQVQEVHTQHQQQNLQQQQQHQQQHQHQHQHQHQLQLQEEQQQQAEIAVAAAADASAKEGASSDSEQNKVGVVATTEEMSIVKDVPDDVRRPASAIIVPEENNASLSVALRSSHSTSHSESTSLIARQTRSDLQALLQAMEAMRSERQSCSSVGALVQQLEGSRLELEVSRKRMMEAEAESANLRREVNLMLKELDSMMLQKKMVENKSEEVLKEKERVVELLRDSLDEKEHELKRVKQREILHANEVDRLRREEKQLQDRLKACSVIERAQEKELASLRGKLEANDAVVTRLNSVVKQTEGLTSEMARQRQTQMCDMVAAARREKELAEEAREDAKRMAQSQRSILEDVRASAAAAAMARSLPSDDRTSGQNRRGSRLYDFWKRLLHRDRVVVDFSTPSASGVGATHRGHGSAQEGAGGGNAGAERMAATTGMHHGGRARRG